MQRPIHDPAGAGTEFLDHGIVREGQIGSPAAANRVGLKSRDRPAFFQVVAKRIEIRMRNVRLADQQVDLIRE